MGSLKYIYIYMQAGGCTVPISNADYFVCTELVINSYSCPPVLLMLFLVFCLVITSRLDWMG
jgi:hypothetical protein